MKEWIIRRFQPDDLERIAEFRQAFPEPLPVKCSDVEYHRWKCYNNPVQPGYIWLAEDGDRIVSTASMTPKSMKLWGRIEPVAETGDTYTLPEYQGRGIFTALVKNTTAEAIKSGINFIYGLPNENSLPGYRSKLDYEVIPSVELYSMGRPLSMKRMLKARFSNPLLVAVLSPVLEIGSRLIFRLAAGISKSNLSISQVISFPDDIESLWERVSRKYDVILVRNREYLRWRYQEAPDSYIILIARSPQGEIFGYTVGKITKDKARRTGFIADFLTIEDNTDNSRVFKKLALALIEVFRQDKVDSIATWAVKGSPYYRAFRKLGFWVGSEVPVICYKNELGNQILNGTYRWHFTLGDSDNI